MSGGRIEEMEPVRKHSTIRLLIAGKIQRLNFCGTKLTGFEACMRQDTFLSMKIYEPLS